VRSLPAGRIGHSSPYLRRAAMPRAGFATSSHPGLAAECPSYDDRECPLPITDPRTSCVQDISDDVVGMPLVRLSLSDLSGQQPGHPCVAKDTNGN
jgi:hypothetical protein